MHKEALNKPLMLLQAIGSICEGLPRLIAFDQIEKKHREALLLFGQKQKASPASYAFWRLQNDKIWEVNSDTAPLLRKSNSDPTSAGLRKANATGGFKEALYKKFQGDPLYLNGEVDFLLREFFPSKLHSVIRSFFGIEISDEKRFSQAVLEAYQFKCAILKQSFSVNSFPLGLCAAPIKRFRDGGSCGPENGICLTENLADLFLVGGFTVVAQGDRYRVLISPKLSFHSDRNAGTLLRGGEPLSVPSDREQRPDQDLLKWHKRHIFIS